MQEFHDERGGVSAENHINHDWAQIHLNSLIERAQGLLPRLRFSWRVRVGLRVIHAFIAVGEIFFGVKVWVLRLLCSLVLLIRAGFIVVNELWRIHVDEFGKGDAFGPENRPR
jgi:hypothetical protein